MESMKLYLDNYCFNRPFDDQTQIRIRLETEAKRPTHEIEAIFLAPDGKEVSNTYLNNQKHLFTEVDF